MRSRLLPGVALLLAASCGRDSTAPPGVTPVAMVTVTPDSSSVARGGTLQLVATTRAADGTLLTGREVTWSSGDVARAAVSAGGVVTGLTAGRVVVTAASEGRFGSAVVVVEAGLLDFAVHGAQFTQAVQAANASIPMILGGNAAVVNVLVRSPSESTTSMAVELRIVDLATESLVHADTVVTTGRLVSSPGYGQPSAQFLVPAAVLRPGLAWRVVRDPGGVVPDDSTANDAFPRTGYAPLGTTEVPSLTVRFVPIVLAAHAGATGAVTDVTIPRYLGTVRRILPVGRIDAHVGEPFVSNATFGTAPRGGEARFWVQVLSELDLARLADPVEPHAHWYGVVRPPAGFDFTEFGGYGYIPASGSDAGANTRTALGVQVDWFNREGQAEDLVAHELGHNFGRRHAPCGGAGSPLDIDYPVAGGTLDEPGHDVYGWVTGVAASALAVPTSTGDIMGYCFPVWTSAYTYSGILDFRSIATAATPAVTALVVRGHVTEGSIQLEPAFTLEARATPPRGGVYRIEGLAADGSVLFTQPFQPAQLDHADDVRSFTVAVPTTPQLESELHTLRVRGPGAEASLSRPTGPPLQPAGPPDQPGVVRMAHGTVRITCLAGPRGVLVRTADGRVLAAATGPSAAIMAASGTELRIGCSDGVATSKHTAIVP